MRGKAGKIVIKCTIFGVCSLLLIFFFAPWAEAGGCDTAFQVEGSANSPNQPAPVSMSSGETVRDGQNAKKAKGDGRRPRVVVEVDVVELRFRAEWRDPLSDLNLLNQPLFAEWEFKGLQPAGRGSEHPRAHKQRNQVKKKTTAANIMEYERTIPSGVRGSFWW